MKIYKPSPLAAGFALAMMRGISVICMGIFGNFRGQYASFVNVMGQFYIGYSIGIGGIILGFLRAIVDGFCSGFILVRLYNIMYRLIRK